MEYWIAANIAAAGLNAGKSIYLAIGVNIPAGTQ